MCSINTMATSPGVIQFHERVFDRCLHFYERVFRLSLHFYERVSCIFRIFMSEFEAKRPRLVVAPVKCSGHLTGTEKRDAHARPTVQPTAIARIAAADLHEQKMHVRVLGLQGKRNTEDGIPTTGRREGTQLCRCGGANARSACPKARSAAWQAWAPGPELPMAAVLTTIRVEMVKTPAIRKSHSSEAPSKPS